VAGLTGVEREREGIVGRRIMQDRINKKVESSAYRKQRLHMYHAIVGAASAAVWAAASAAIAVAVAVAIAAARSAAEVAGISMKADSTPNNSTPLTFVAWAEEGSGFLLFRCMG
jgi:hypothetical protein